MERIPYTSFSAFQVNLQACSFRQIVPFQSVCHIQGPLSKSRWRVEYKQYADRKLVAELVAVSEIGSRYTLRLFVFLETKKRGCLKSVRIFQFNVAARQKRHGYQTRLVGIRAVFNLKIMF